MKARDYGEETIEYEMALGSYNISQITKLKQTFAADKELLKRLLAAIEKTTLQFRQKKKKNRRRLSSQEDTEGIPFIPDQKHHKNKKYVHPNLAGLIEVNN